MGLFGNKKPKLPKYFGVGLDALLQDPEWAYAISQAGIDTRRCEIVVRLARATVVGQGPVGTAEPAILFGQDNTLAIAALWERGVEVRRRDKSTAKLQPHDSGASQIVFGQGDYFLFRGPEDNLRIGTPEGETFEKIMSAFLKGWLQPQQVFGTPQSLASGGVSVEPPAPTFEDPDDLLRWKLVHSLQASLAELMKKHTQCVDKANYVQKCSSIANAQLVNGVPPAEESRRAFRMTAVKGERELEGLLGELREATIAAKYLWKDLVFLLPGSENDVMKIMNWCISHGVDSEVWSSIATDGVLTQTDFGVTMESFLAENDRVIAVMTESGQ